MLKTMTAMKCSVQVTVMLLLVAASVAAGASVRSLEVSHATMAPEGSSSVQAVSHNPRWLNTVVNGIEKMKEGLAQFTPLVPKQKPTDQPPKQPTAVPLPAPADSANGTASPGQGGNATIQQPAAGKAKQLPLSNSKQFWESLAKVQAQDGDKSKAVQQEPPPQAQKSPEPQPATSPAPVAPSPSPKEPTSPAPVQSPVPPIVSESPQPIPSPSPAPKPSPIQSPMPGASPFPVPVSPSPEPPVTPSPVPSPSPEPSPSPSPLDIVTPSGPSAGVNAGAVMGTVGGIAIILAVAWLILHSRRRRLRKEHWSVAQPPIYSVSSFKEPLSQAGTDQLGNYNPAQVCPSRHKDHKRHHSGQLNGNAGAAARADVEPVVDAGRGAMVLGFTGDDLQAGLSDLKHIITNRLLPAVDASKLTIDVVAAWLDAGVDSVHSSGSGDYTASPNFADDWRTHRVWDWLNHCYWRFIPTDKRLLQVQVPTNTSLSQLEYARHTLDQINNGAHCQPFAAAVDAAVDAILANAVAVATSQGILPQPSSTASAGGNSSSGPYPEVQHAGASSASQPAAAAAAAAAGRYYQAALRDLCEAALRFHLQVQGTAEGVLIYVPGAFDALDVAVPAEGLVCTNRKGGVRTCCMCERPGVLSSISRGVGGVSVWVPAYAVNVVPN